MNKRLSRERGREIDVRYKDTDTDQEKDIEKERKRWIKSQLEKFCFFSIGMYAYVAKQ